AGAGAGPLPATGGDQWAVGSGPWAVGSAFSGCPLPPAPRPRLRIRRRRLPGPLRRPRRPGAAVGPAVPERVPAPPRPAAGGAGGAGGGAGPAAAGAAAAAGRAARRRFGTRRAHGPGAATMRAGRVRPGAAMKVLIAEDETVSRLLLENILGEWGYAVVTTG